MNARQSNAYLLSGLLHGTVVALVLFLGYAASQNSQDPPKVFDLIAGVGDNYAGTVAPALGVPGGIKLKVSIPAPPAPAPEPAPVEAAPPPRPVPAPLPKAPKTPPAPATAAKSDEVPNFTKLEQRVAHKKEARLEALYKKQALAEQKRQEQIAKAAAARSLATTKVPQIDAEGIAKGVFGGSTANKVGGAGGKALTREEGDERDTYFAMLKARLRENFAAPADMNDKLVTIVEFFIAADGSISRVRILHSSGNPEFDEAVRDAFAHTRVPAPPDGAGGLNKTTFRAKDDDAG